MGSFNFILEIRPFLEPFSGFSQPDNSWKTHCLDFCRGELNKPLRPSPYQLPTGRVSRLFWAVVTKTSFIIFWLNWLVKIPWQTIIIWPRKYIIGGKIPDPTRVQYVYVMCVTYNFIEILIHFSQYSRCIKMTT